MHTNQSLQIFHHQVFLNRRAIFVLVYNASQDLKLSSKADAEFEHEVGYYVHVIIFI